MSKNVENRIVEMTFENKDFEKNANQTIQTLETLDDKLKLSDSSKNIQKTGDAMNNHLVVALDKVAIKFSALQTIASTVLTNITNKVMSVATNISDKLFIAPIKTGFSEYETQIDAVQTILANTRKEGATLKDVTAALDELNEYADLTIYNFTEMTNNIGRFTSAGVDLKTSTASIQGLANAAAIGGSNAQQASTAMYQLSQAMAAGVIRLQDWMSLENSNVASASFKDAIIETARARGVAIDDLIEKYGNFRLTLQENWLTSDIMAESLKKFTTTGANEYISEHSKVALKDVEAMRKDANAAKDRTAAYKNMAAQIAKSSDLTADQIFNILDLSQTAEDAATKVKTFTQLWGVLQEASQSGWAKTWQIVIGDFEEAKDLLTKISDELTARIGESADARNNMLEAWKKLGGRNEVIKGFENIYNVVMKVYTTIKEAFNNIFPPMTAEKLFSISEGFRKLTEKLEPSEETLWNIREIFKAIFNVIKLVAQGIGLVWRAISPALSKIGTAISFIFNIIGWAATAFNAHIVDGFIPAVKQAAGAIWDMVKYGAGLGEFIDGTLNPMWEIIKIKLQPVIELFVKLLVKFKFSLLETFGTGSVSEIVNQQLDKLKNKFKSFYETFSKLTFSEKLDYVKQKFTELYTNIKNFFVNFSIHDKLAWLLDQLDKLAEKVKNMNSAGAGLNAITIKLKLFLEALKDTIASLFTGNFDYKSSWISKFVTVLAGGGGLYMLIKAFKSIKGIFDNIFDVIDFAKVKKTLTIKLGGIADAIGNFGKKITKSISIGNIKQIAIAIGILTASLFIIANLDGEKASRGIASIGLMLGELLIFLKLFEKIEVASLKQLSGLVAVGVAVGLLSGVVSKIAKLGDDSASGILGLAAIMGGLVAFEYGISQVEKSSGLVTKGLWSLTVISLAIGMLGGVVRLLSGMELGPAAIGLGSLYGIMLLLVQFEKAIGLLTQNGIKASGYSSLLALAGAIGIVAIDIKLLATNDWKQALVGGASLIAVMALFIGFEKMLYVATHGENSKIEMAPLIALAAAIALLSLDIKLLATNDWKQALVGGASLTAVMLMIVGFEKLLYVATHGDNSKIVLGPLISLSAAIGIIGVAYRIMSGIDWNGFAVASASMIVAMGAFIAFEKLIEKFKVKNSETKILEVISFATSLAVVAAIMKRFNKIEFGSIAKAFVAFGGAIAAMWAIGEIVSKIDDSTIEKYQKVKELQLSLLELSIGLMALGLAMKVISSIGWSGAAVSLVTLLGIVAILGVSVKAMSGLASTALTLSKSLLIFAGAIALLGISLGTLALGVATFAGTAAVISSSGDDIKAALQVIIQVVDSLVPLLVKTLFNFIHQTIQGLRQEAPYIVESTIQILLDVLKILTQKIDVILAAVVDFLNALVRGIANVIHKLDLSSLGNALLVTITVLGSTIGLMKLAAKLKLETKDAMIGIAKAALVLAEIGGIIAAFGLLNKIPGVRKIVDSGGELLSAIGAALGGFVGSLVGGVAASFLDMVGSVLPEFGKHLSDFAENLGPFINTMSKIDKGMTDGMLSLTESLFLLTTSTFIEEVGNLFDALTLGLFHEDAKSMAQDLVDFGSGIAEFAVAIKNSGIDEKTMTSIGYLTEAVAKLVDAQPTFGGVAGFFAGDANYAKLGQQLVDFIAPFKEFSVKVSAIPTDIVEKTATVTDVINTLASVEKDAASNVFGITDFITGHFEFDTFAEELIRFIEPFNEFADKVRGDYSNVVNFVPVMKALGELSGIEGIQEGFTLDAAFGNSFGGALGFSMTLYAKDLIGVSEALEEVSENFKVVDSEAVLSGINLVKQLAGLGGIELDNIKALSTQMQKISTVNMKQFINAFVEGAGSGALLIIMAFSSMFNQIMAACSAQASIAGLSLGNSVAVLVRGLTSKGYSEAMHAATQLKAYGMMILNGFIVGVESRAASASSAIASVIRTATYGINSSTAYNDFYNAGVNMVKGFVNGMKDSEWRVAVEATALATLAVEKAKARLKQNSPSKVMIKVGEGYDEGFALGIRNLSDDVALAATEVSEASIQAVQKSISKISDYVDLDDVPQPVITPVMDLSNVENGARNISLLFNRNQAVAISGRMDRRAQLNADEIQNGLRNGTSGNTITFTQNNYSPKALSKIDIYRQTRNQISRLKGYA